MPGNNVSPEFFDVSYGLASVSVTTGLTVITTTGASYHGCSIIAGSTTKATVTIYDNASATTGNVVDTFTVTADGNVWIDRFIPIMARDGLTLSLTGTGANGAVFYGPKG